MCPVSGGVRLRFGRIDLAGPRSDHLRVAQRLDCICLLRHPKANHQNFAAHIFNAAGQFNTVVIGLGASSPTWVFTRKRRPSRPGTIMHVQWIHSRTYLRLKQRLWHTK